MIDLGIAWLAVGFGLAAGGGHLLVKGLSKLGHHFGIREAAVGLTLAAWATSGPEMAVAINASMDSMGELAMGDTLGSNVLNLALILGLSLIMAPLDSPAADLFTSHITALLTPFLTTILVMDGILSRFDAFILLMLFAVWAMTLVKGSRQALAAPRPRTRSSELLPVFVFIALGTGLLFLSGKSVVLGAEAIQKVYPIDSFLIGAALVSFGTSIPELATILIARWKGHHELSLGALLGSNIFNGLFILGVAGSIQSIKVSLIPCLLTLLFGAAAVGMTFSKDGLLTRGRGFLLVLSYVLYLFVTAWASG